MYTAFAHKVLDTNIDTLRTLRIRVRMNFVRTSGEEEIINVQHALFKAKPNNYSEDERLINVNVEKYETE